MLLYRPVPYSLPRPSKEAGLSLRHSNPLPAEQTVSSSPSPSPAVLLGHWKGHSVTVIILISNVYGPITMGQAPRLCRYSLMDSETVQARTASLPAPPHRGPGNCPPAPAHPPASRPRFTPCSLPAPAHHAPPCAPSFPSEGGLGSAGEFHRHSARQRRPARLGVQTLE